MKKSTQSCLGALHFFSGLVYLAAYAGWGTQGFIYAVIGWSLCIGAVHAGTAGLAHAAETLAEEMKPGAKQ